MKPSENDKRLIRARQLLGAGDHAAVETLCEQVLDEVPGDVRAWAMMAQAALLRGDPSTAVTRLRRLTELTPDEPAAYLALGQALSRLERDPEAIAALEHCLQLEPHNAEAVRALGNIMSRAGDGERATRLMRRALELNPRDTAAHYQLTTLVRADRDDPRPAQLEALFSEAGFSDRERSRIAFSLARILDQQGRYANAFEWFGKANALRRRESDFDIGKDQAWVGRAIEVFTPELFASRSGTGSDSELPVFIVGLPRSGSTLLEQVLASHPDIHGAGESMLLAQTVGTIGRWLPAGAPLPESIAEVPAPAWQELGAAYVKQAQALAPRARRIVDKQLFNYTLAGFIRLMLPRARILHVSRHPQATCLSCYMTAFRQDRGFAYDLADLGQTWRLYRRIMEHWDRVIPGAILEVRYENMLENLEGEARRALKFVGLPWSDNCLEFHRTERPVRTASKTQVRQPLYKSSRDHWRNYEPFLGPLREAMREGGAQDGSG